MILNQILSTVLKSNVWRSVWIICYVDLGVQRVKSRLGSFYSNRIIDGSNLTMSDEHMWLIPFTDGQDHLLTVDLGQPTPLIGLRVWNYNKSIDDTFRGVRNVVEISASQNFAKF